MSKNNFVEVTIDPPVFTETVIIPGKQGIPGDKGDPGATPNIQIGTVQTLPAESPATASMTGTPENPLLNLGIPQGKDGVGGGINVTGATVGQTVKISAVDDNGKPTAWEAVDLTVGDKWELLGTLNASTADVLQLEFPSQMRQIMFYSQITDSAGDLYGPSTTAYRTVSLLTGKWGLLNGVNIGMCSHNWGIACKGHLMCEQEFSWGEIAKPSLTATTSLLCITPARRITNDVYYSGNVSGIRFTTVLPADVENTASGTIKIWGVRA